MAEQAAPCLEVSRASSWQSVALPHLQAVRAGRDWLQSAIKGPVKAFQVLCMADRSSGRPPAASHTEDNQSRAAARHHDNSNLQNQGVVSSLHLAGMLPSGLAHGTVQGMQPNQ